MAIIREQESVLAIKIEATYGVDPVVDATNIIEFNAGAKIPEYDPDTQERNVIRNTASDRDSVIGAELNASGELSLELHGSGVAATPTPESDPLWECAIGAKTAKTGSTTVAAGTPTTTTFSLTAATGFADGDAITVVTTNGTEAVFITGLTGVAVTCSPALSVAPAVGAAVKNIGVKYTLISGDHKSFWMSYWFGNAIRRNVPGNKINKLSLDFSTGKLINPSFSFDSQKTQAPITESCSFLGSATFDTANPLVATNMGVTIGGVTYPVESCKVELDLPQYKRQAVTGSGISNIIRAGKRKVTGSFSLLYENSTVETALRAGTKGDLILICNGGLGNIYAVRMPAIKYLKAPISSDNGLYKLDVTFQCTMATVSSSQVGESEFAMAIM